MIYQTYLHKLILNSLFVFLLMTSSAAAGMISSNFSISSLNENHGSGSRNSLNYRITSDAICKQPTGSSTSTNYTLTARDVIVPFNESQFSSGIYINANDGDTNSGLVTLSLICGSPSGCAEVSISNNGVSWSDPEPYSTFKTWTLITNDGERKVFVKFKNGLGEWSGVSSDSIVLDTTPPQTTISPVGGTFMSAAEVTLTASESATIYYTTDGSLPTKSSTVYSGPITISTDTTLQCLAEDIAGNVGAVASEQFAVCNGSNLSISGVVRDGTVDNKGMPLVVVTLNTGQTATTDQDGNYSFGSLQRGYYTIESITTPSPGYVTYQEELILCKSSITHDIILTKNNTVFGGDTFSGYSLGSVNTATGNFFYEERDLAIPGRGFSFAFERSYNSQDESDGPLGVGWTHNYNIELYEGADGDVTVRWGDGKAETWVPDGTGGYSPMQGVFDTLIKNPDNTFTIQRKDMIEYHFDVSNKLVTIEDENGNTLIFSYSGNNIASIVDTAGRNIEFSYDANGRITRILGPIGRSVTFTYDVNGDLISSTDLGGNTTTYAYDENHQILTITDPFGNVVITNTYDEQRKAVSSQKDAFGAETLYSYDVANKVTQIVDPHGSVSYHHFDDLLRLTQEEDALGNSAFYAYDERGNISTVKDKNGNVTSYEYDDNGNVLVKTDPLGNQSSATYDENNNPLTKTDANGNTTTFRYDANGNLLTITDPLGNTTTYTYDDFGQMLTITDALGSVTSNEYDLYGNVVAVTDALGNRSTFTYDLVGRKLTETHPLGRATAYEYDDMDQLVSVTDALGGVSSFTYDANGNKTEHVDGNGNKTTFTYDAKNRLISKTTPLNETEQYTYDLLDRRTAVTNPRGAISSIGYDNLGNVIHEIDALNNHIQHEYDPNGNRTETIDAMGNSTAFVYDDLNRLVSKTDPLGNAESYTYDANGNRLTVTDALGNTSGYAYDQVNRLISITDPLNNVTINSYDAVGRLVSVIDAKGQETSFEYDAVGRITKVIDAASGEVTATYDAIDNRTSITDTRGNTTTYTYDVLNRLVSETDPLGNAQFMNYDSVGNLVSLSDANGSTTYTYNQNNRLETVTYPNATTVSYTYDPNGNRVCVSDLTGTTSYEYSLLDQIVSVTDPFGLTVGYTYDPNRNRTSLKYPGNKTVTYYYDRLDRLASVQDWGGITTAYQYDAAGRLILETMGNGATASYTYDSTGRLTGKEDKTAGGSVIASYTFTLDEVGNRTAMSITQPLLPRIDFVDDSFAHNSGNQVVSGGGAAFSYDGKGNRTGRSEGSVTTQYAYNYDDMLTRVDDGTNVYEYLYNSDGHRLASEENGVETRYLLDVNGGMEFILAEMDGSNSIRKYYVYGDGLLYSVDAATGERLYYHYDAIGSTVAITDSLGNVTDKYGYLPFGALTSSETVHDNPFTYVGKYGVMQESNGLYFMRARFYDPFTKRFLGEDRVTGILNDPSSLPKYAYARNNPIKWLDPTGEFLPVVFEVHVYISKTINFLGRAGMDVLRYVPMDDPASMKIAEWWAKTISGGSIFGNKISSLSMESGIVYETIDSMVNRSATAMGKDVTGEELTFNPPKNKASIPRKIETRKPRRYLSVRNYAAAFFREEFAKLKDPDFVDNQTRSYIEWRIELELNALQTKRYGYRTKEQKKRKKAEMLGDIERSAKRLYTSLTNTLSKYSVLIQDLDKLPDFNSGNLNRRGVYTNN